MTEKAMFEDAQNGDRVCDFNLGWGSINNMATDTKRDFYDGTLPPFGCLSEYAQEACVQFPVIS